MSEPTRYTAVGNGVVRTDPEGLLIAYGHYVELKDEVERLTKAGDELHAFLAEKEHAERLESENAILMRRTALLMEQVERLTKAGDAMADRLMYQGYPATVPAWLAAKESKPGA